MSKQQDELREQIHILLVDYDRAGMWQGSASKEIMKLVNSEVQAALNRVYKANINRKVISPKMRTIYNETFVPLSVIEEVRKDYE
jgi:hypothetical protein